MGTGAAEQAMTGGAARKRAVLTTAQRAAANPRRTVWVSASAGSGKTHVLSARILSLMLQGAEPESILCLTYTKAAATEMATRLFSTLSSWNTLDDEALCGEIENLGMDGGDTDIRRKARQLFASALEAPGGLKIQTIHAFCERLLQLFPVEAQLAPGFRVMDEEQERRLLDDALSLALTSNKQEVAEAWGQLAAQGLRNARQLQRFAAEFLAQGWGALELLGASGASALLERICGALGLAPGRSAADWLDELNRIDLEQYRRWLRLIESASGFDPKTSTTDRGAQEKLRQILSGQGPGRSASLISFYLTDKHVPRADILRKGLADTLHLEPEMRTEQARVEMLLNFHKLRSVAEASVAAAVVMQEVLAAAGSLNRMRNLYNFDDLINRTAMLLSSSADAQWVLYKLDRGLSHILVDEAQDTSPRQWQIITTLAEEFFAGSGQHGKQSRSVFAVGDRKQSIFSFQGADLPSYDDAHDWLRRQSSSAGGLLDVDLTVSYRSLRNVLAAVDTVFFTGGRARQGFGARGQEERDHEAKRKDQPGLFEIWPLVTRERTFEPAYWSAPDNRFAEDHPRLKLARLIARTIATWIGKRKLHGSERIVAAGDILILVQRRNSLFAALIAEIRQLGIPVAGADRLKLSEHLIVSDLLALAQVVLLPGDDHSLACLLKSPLMPAPLDDAALTSLAAARATVTLRERLLQEPLQALNAQALLEYERLAERFGPFDFFSLAVHRHLTAVATRLGSEAEDAARAFLDLAMEYEREEGPSLAGFASWMKASEATVKREMEEAQGQLRIMTGHGAKGLEAPIVILADAADHFHARDETRLLWMEPNGGLDGIPLFLPDMPADAPIIKRLKQYREEMRFQENMRLLYVGMTRACDELYVCGCYSEKEPHSECWWKLIDQAISRPTGLAFRAHELIDGSVARRLGPDDVLVPRETAEENAARLLPEWLHIAVPVSGDGLRRTASLSDETVDFAAARRGAAIHALLERLPDWPADRRREMALKRGKRHGLDDALIERLIAVVSDPDSAVFFGPGSRAEVEICGVLQSGETVVGRIDRLAQYGSEFFILDYKSGQRPREPLAADHAIVRQVAGYAALLREAHEGAVVRAALLWTQSGTLQWIPDDLLQNGPFGSYAPAS
jgi:ATP-dependent helicase/nuclease subunit A